MIDRPVSKAVYNLLRGLATTRRVRRRLPSRYGTDGEFYVRDDNHCVIDHNTPPGTQPSLYCQWLIQPDRRTIRWDGNEKFYEYGEWLVYLARLIRSKGYVLTGDVIYRGEIFEDVGSLHLTPTSLETTWNCGGFVPFQETYAPPVKR